MFEQMTRDEETAQLVISLLCDRKNLFSVPGTQVKKPGVTVVPGLGRELVAGQLSLRQALVPSEVLSQTQSGQLQRSNGRDWHT